jgi:hypothetical protein
LQHVAGSGRCCEVGVSCGGATGWGSCCVQHCCSELQAASCICANMLCSNIWHNSRQQVVGAEQHLLSVHAAVMLCIMCGIRVCWVLFWVYEIRCMKLGALHQEEPMLRDHGRMIDGVERCGQPATAVGTPGVQLCTASVMLWLVWCS